MAIPNEPYTRKEQYLNAMATGNASGVPDTPYTREEMYLDAIAKGGGGGSAGGAALVVGSTTEGSTTTLNKTWQEIHDAFIANGVVVVDGEFLVSVAAVLTSHGQYSVCTSNSGMYSECIFSATSANGYPSYTEG